MDEAEGEARGQQGERAWLAYSYQQANVMNMLGGSFNRGIITHSEHLPRDLMSPSQFGRGSTSEGLAGRKASVQGAINKALHREGTHARVQDIFLTQSGKYRGSTRPTNNADQLLEHRDAVIRAARTVDPGVTDLEAKTSWWWIKVEYMRNQLPVSWVGGRMVRSRSARGSRSLGDTMAERSGKRQGLAQ